MSPKVTKKQETHEEEYMRIRQEALGSRLLVPTLGAGETAMAPLFEDVITVYSVPSRGLPDGLGRKDVVLALATAIGLIGRLFPAPQETISGASEITNMSLPRAAQCLPQWMAVIATLLYAVFSYGGSVTGVTIRELPIAVIRQLMELKRLVDGMGRLLSREDDETIQDTIAGPATGPQLEKIIGLLAAISESLGFPHVEATVGSAARIGVAGSVKDIHEVMAMAALYVYIAGKSIPSAQVSDPGQLLAYNAVSKRAGNLQHAHKESVGPWEYVTGAGSLAQHSVRAICRAWSSHLAVRVGLIEPLLTVRSGKSGKTGAIFTTVLNLMDGAGMQSASICAEFLDQYPFVWNIPALTGELAFFMESVRAELQIPVSTRPYYRLLHGDAAHLYNRKRLIKLTGLAVSVMSETDENLEHFEHTADAAIREDFDHLRSLRHKTVFGTKDVARPTAKVRDPGSISYGQFSGIKEEETESDGSEEEPGDETAPAASQHQVAALPAEEDAPSQWSGEPTDYLEGATHTPTPDQRYTALDDEGKAQALRYLQENPELMASYARAQGGNEEYGDGDPFSETEGSRQRADAGPSAQPPRSLSWGDEAIAADSGGLD